MKPNARLKEIRIRKGYSQEYLAQHSGMSRAQYASIEQGRKRLYAHELASISKALGTTADFILFGYEIEKMYGYLNIAGRRSRLPGGGGATCPDFWSRPACLLVILLFRDPIRRALS